MSALTALTLTACGGRGGGTGGTPVVVVPLVCTAPLVLNDAHTACVVPPPPASGNIVTTVADLTYAPGSEELAAFSLLNAERAHCGFGLVAQNAKLDQAARAHADWQLVNNYSSHYEVADTPGFTGVMPADRMVTAGYAEHTFDLSWADEIASWYSDMKTGRGTRGMRGLLNAPYHARGLIAGFRDGGLSLRNTLDVGTGWGAILQIDLANMVSAGRQVVGSTEVLTYPCQGSSGVDYVMDGEDPNPVPGRDLAAQPLGVSVQVMVREGNTLVITSASMTKVATGAVVALRAPVTGANDPLGRYGSHNGYVAADARMEPSTEYQVTLAGTNNGAAFGRTFSFTTGTGLGN